MRACSLCGFVECECPNRFTQQPLRVVDYTQPEDERGNHDPAFARLLLREPATKFCGL